MPRISSHPSPFKRPTLHQFLNTAGRITHVVEYGSRSAAFVRRIAEEQLNRGYDVQIIALPGSQNAAKLLRTQHPADISDKIPFFIGAPANIDRTMSSGNYLDELSNYFWYVLTERSTELCSLIHAHGENMGIVISCRPQGISVPMIYSPFEAEPAHRMEETANLVNKTLLWSRAQFRSASAGSLFHNVSSDPGDLQSKVAYLTCDWLPREEPEDTENMRRSLNVMHQHYYKLVFGSGLDQTHMMLQSPAQQIAHLLLNTQTHPRARRTWRDFNTNPGLRPIYRHISTFCWGRPPEESNPDILNMPDDYTYSLGTIAFLIKAALPKLSKDTPIAAVINDAGTSTRETPVVQVLGAKGLLEIGSASMNEAVARSLELIAKQLPPGRWLIISGSDNLFAGILTVGDHLLAEDAGHGLFSLTRPFNINELPRNTSDLGWHLLHQVTGARMGFSEKPKGRDLDRLKDEAKAGYGGIAHANTMIKIMREDVAILLMDREHLSRVSFADKNKSLLAAYAENEVDCPDWSLLFDNPTIGKETLNLWMEKWEKLNSAGKTKFHRSDWRLFWIVNNDIVLQSLQNVALSKKYFGQICDASSSVVNGSVAFSESEWKTVNRACIDILKSSAKFAADETIPKKWFFKRCCATGLSNNWKEIFLAALCIKHNRGDRAKSAWGASRPANVTADKWAKLFEIAEKLGGEENGIVGAAIDGPWLDTGEKPQLAQASLLIVAPDVSLQSVVRELLSTAPAGVQVDDSVTLQPNDCLMIGPGKRVFIGSNSVLSCPNGGRIEPGNDVVISQGSVIKFMGGPGSVLQIPDNTIICASSMNKFAPGVADPNLKLIYHFHQRPDGKYRINGVTGPKDIEFGFYGGVCWVSFPFDQAKQDQWKLPLLFSRRPELFDTAFEQGIITQRIDSLEKASSCPADVRARLLDHFHDIDISATTIFPLHLNLKDRPDLGLLGDEIRDPDLKHHFRTYYGLGEQSVYSRLVPFIGLPASKLGELVLIQ